MAVTQQDMPVSAGSGKKEFGALEIGRIVKENLTTL